MGRTHSVVITLDKSRDLSSGKLSLLITTRRSAKVSMTCGVHLVSAAEGACDGGQLHEAGQQHRPVCVLPHQLLEPKHEAACTCHTCTGNGDDSLGRTLGRAMGIGTGNGYWGRQWAAHSGTVLEHDSSSSTQLGLNMAPYRMNPIVWSCWVYFLCV